MSAMGAAPDPGWGLNRAAWRATIVATGSSRRADLRAATQRRACGEGTMSNTDRLAHSSLAPEEFIMPLSRRALLGGIAAGTVVCAAGSPGAAAQAAAETAAAGEQITEAQRLAQFAADISFDKLPASTVAAVKRLVLD